MGSGTFEGAVKTTVLLVFPLAGILPVSAVQLFLFPVTGFPEESNVVVVYWQVHVLILVLVLPLTVAVKVSDCETITALVGAVTSTVTTFVLLPPPPQPASASKAARTTSSRG